MRREGRIHGYEFDRQQGVTRAKASAQPTNRSKTRPKWPQEKAGRPSSKALKKSKGQKNKGIGAGMDSDHRKMHDRSISSLNAEYLEDDADVEHPDADLAPPPGNGSSYVAPLADYAACFDADVAASVPDAAHLEDHDADDVAATSPRDDLLESPDEEGSSDPFAPSVTVAITRNDSGDSSDGEYARDRAPAAIAFPIVVLHSQFEEADEHHIDDCDDWFDIGASTYDDDDDDDEQDVVEEEWLLC